MTGFVRVGDRIVPRDRIREIDVSALAPRGSVRVYVHGHLAPIELRGADAVDLVMRVAPAAVEGKRLRWLRSAWAMHNLVGHPLLQLLAWAGRRAWGLRVHDATIPRPLPRGPRSR